MEIIKNVQAKLKNFQAIQNDLKETRIAENSVDEYGVLYEVYTKGVKKVDKIEKKVDKAESEYIKQNNKVIAIKKEMAKMRKKAGLLARLQFSRVCFWNAKGKTYRTLKKKLARAKSRRDMSNLLAKTLRTAIKSKENEVKVTRKVMKASEKTMRRIWKNSKEQIQQIKDINANREQLEAQYGKKYVENLIEKIRTDAIEGKNTQEVVKQEQTTEKPQTNNIQEEVKSGIVFDQHTKLNRDFIAQIQKQHITIPEVKNLTPEEFMVFIGCVQAKERSGKRYQYSEIYKEIEKGVEANAFYAKSATKSIEKMLKEMKNIKDPKTLTGADRLIYLVCQNYKMIEKENAQQRKQQEVVVENTVAR